MYFFWVTYEIRHIKSKKRIPFQNSNQNWCPQMQVSNLISTYHCYHHQHRISSSLFLLRSMVTATSSSSSSSVAATSTGGGAFTTIAERVSLERDIKKSKFIAIAGHIPDERSAQSFLSEVYASGISLAPVYNID